MLSRDDIPNPGWRAYNKVIPQKTLLKRYNKLVFTQDSIQHHEEINPKLEYYCALIDRKYRNKKGYGACPVLASKVFESIGGIVIAGDYEGTRHYWVEKDGLIYDMNNIDFDNDVKLLIRDINDYRYDKSRSDSYILNSVEEIRDNAEELGLMTKDDFNALYNKIPI